MGPAPCPVAQDRRRGTRQVSIEFLDSFRVEHCARVMSTPIILLTFSGAHRRTRAMSKPSCSSPFYCIVFEKNIACKFVMLPTLTCLSKTQKNTSITDVSGTLVPHRAVTCIIVSPIGHSRTLFPQVCVAAHPSPALCCIHGNASPPCLHVRVALGALLFLGEATRVSEVGDHNHRRDGEEDDREREVRRWC